MDLNELLAYVVIFGLIAAAIVGGIAGVSYLFCLDRVGQRYDVTVTVQAVERSTRFGDHTNLWVRVYGQQDITYKLIGFHLFEVGETYHLVFVDEPCLCWWIVWWFEVQGRVVSTELVQGETP